MRLDDTNEFSYNLNNEERISMQWTIRQSGQVEILWLCCISLYTLRRETDCPAKYCIHRLRIVHGNKVNGNEETIKNMCT